MSEPRASFRHDVPLLLHRHFRFQWEPSQECHVLLYPEGMVQLRGGAAEVMKLIDGKTTLDQLTAALEAAFPGADLRQDVLEFTEIAHAKGWIVLKSESDTAASDTAASDTAASDTAE
jgi:pyrroloquinoline quinone biosynthesis protein D